MNATKYFNLQLKRLCNEYEEVTSSTSKRFWNEEYDRISKEIDLVKSILNERNLDRKTIMIIKWFNIGGWIEPYENDLKHYGLQEYFNRLKRRLKEREDKIRSFY